MVDTNPNVSGVRPVKTHTHVGMRQSRVFLSRSTHVPPVPGPSPKRPRWFAPAPFVGTGRLRRERVRRRSGVLVGSVEQIDGFGLACGLIIYQGLRCAKQTTPKDTHGGETFSLRVEQFFC